MQLSTKNKIIDICCRIMSTDGEVTLDERIWLHNLIEHNNQARGIVERIMCPYKVEDM